MSVCVYCIIYVRDSHEVAVPHFLHLFPICLQGYFLTDQNSEAIV